MVNYNVYWPIIGHLYCMTSIFIRHYKLLNPCLVKFKFHTNNVLIFQSVILFFWKLIKNHPLWKRLKRKKNNIVQIDTLNLFFCRFLNIRLMCLKIMFVGSWLPLEPLLCLSGILQLLPHLVQRYVNRRYIDLAYKCSLKKMFWVTIN